MGHFLISGGSVPPFPWPICESYFSARREAQKKCRCNRPIPVPAVAYGRRCVFHDGGTEKEGFRPAAGRHGIYGDGKVGGCVERPRSSAACCLETDLSMKRLMTVNIFSWPCGNVIIPSFITFIVYQKAT